MRYADLRWVPPRSYSRGRSGGPPRFIVVHYTAGAERSSSAEDGAAYDQRRTDGVSTHYFVDSNSVVQCVDTNDRAHAALYHGNLWGIQYELCGTVQTREQWMDVASLATLKLAARQIARDLVTHDIPLAKLVGSAVRNGRGLCGHVDCTVGFPEDGGTHTDPGREFPWDVLMGEIGKVLPKPPTIGVHNMPLLTDRVVHGTRDDGSKVEQSYNDYLVQQRKNEDAIIGLLTEAVVVLANLHVPS